MRKWHASSPYDVRNLSSWQYAVCGNIGATTAVLQVFGFGQNQQACHGFVFSLAGIFMLFMHVRACLITNPLKLSQSLSAEHLSNWQQPLSDCTAFALNLDESCAHLGWSKWWRARAEFELLSLVSLVSNVRLARHSKSRLCLSLSPCVLAIKCTHPKKCSYFVSQ